VDDVSKLQSVQSGNEQTLTAKLAVCGEYRLDVYEPRDNKGLQHIRTYLINRSQEQSQQPGDKEAAAETESSEQEQLALLSEEDRAKFEKDKAQG
jgi:hypothetical protein